MKKFVSFLKSTKWISRILFFLWLFLSVFANFPKEIRLQIVLEFGAFLLVPAIIVEIVKNPIFKEMRNKSVVAKYTPTVEKKRKSETSTSFVRFAKSTKIISRVLFFIWAGYILLFLRVALADAFLFVDFVYMSTGVSAFFLIPAAIIEYKKNPVILGKNPNRQKAFLSHNIWGIILLEISPFMIMVGMLGVHYSKPNERVSSLIPLVLGIGLFVFGFLLISGYVTKVKLDKEQNVQAICKTKAKTAPMEYKKPKETISVQRNKESSSLESKSYMGHSSLFSDISISGTVERSQAIPVRKTALVVQPKKTPSSIAVSITTNIKENDTFDFDFDSSDYGYSSHDKFMKDMKKFEDKAGNKVPFAPFMRSWPTYENMDRSQKAWYFYWRNEVRNERYPDTDLSYIFVHIYEILSGFGWKEASNGYVQLMKLWEAYKERFPKLDNYLFDWSRDFAQLHNLNYSPPEGADLRLPSQAALRDILIDCHREDRPLKLSFAFVDALCDYSIADGKFYKDGNQMLMHNAIPRVVALADAALLKKKGKGILELYGPNRTRKQTYYAFQGAVCPHANQRIEISVRAYTSSQKLRTYINELVRYAENVLREIYGYRGRLRGIELDSETAALVRGFLKKEYSVKPAVSTTKQKIEFNLDLKAIETLRAESNAVRDALEVTEADVSKTRLLTDLNEVTALVSALSSGAKEFLYAFFIEKWSAVVEPNSKAYVEEINRAAMQCLARELVVIENKLYIVEDDYRDELEHIFTTNPDIIKKPPEASPKSESTTSTTNDLFNVTNLSEGLKNVIAALTDIQKQVLWAIVSLADPQDHINTLADEAMTMPEILIDEINDIASQEIDDILIDTFNDITCIFEQYEQELKDAAIPEVG